MKAIVFVLCACLLFSCVLTRDNKKEKTSSWTDATELELQTVSFLQLQTGLYKGESDNQPPQTTERSEIPSHPPNEYVTSSTVPVMEPPSLPDRAIPMPQIHTIQELPFPQAFPTDEFPSDPPPRPPPRNAPPLAPSGRWLHSAVLLNNKMFVYGGVTDPFALLNDMWIFNEDEKTWIELMAPSVQGLRAATEPVTPLSAPSLTGRPKRFTPLARPPDIPPPPAFRCPPGSACADLKSNAKGEIYNPDFKSRIPVVAVEPMPVAAMANPSSFLSLSQTLQFKSKSQSRFMTSSRSESTSESKMLATSAALFKSKALPIGVLSDLWAFDFVTDKWAEVKAIGQVPYPRWMHTAVVIKDIMYVFGGTSTSFSLLNDMWIFDPAAVSWLQADVQGDRPLAREGHTAIATPREQVLIFGGCSYAYFLLADLWLYQPNARTWEMVKPTNDKRPSPRWMHSASFIYNADGKQQMFIFGGASHNMAPLNDLWVFEIENATWTELQPTGWPPFPRWLHAASIVDLNIYIFGGVSNNMPQDDVWKYSIKSNEWSEVHSISLGPAAREGATMVAVGPEFATNPSVIAERQAQAQNAQSQTAGTATGAPVKFMESYRFREKEDGVSVPAPRLEDPLSILEAEALRIQEEQLGPQQLDSMRQYDDPMTHPRSIEEIEGDRYTLFLEIPKPSRRKDTDPPEEPINFEATMEGMENSKLPKGVVQRGPRRFKEYKNHWFVVFGGGGGTAAATSGAGVGLAIS